MVEKPQPSLDEVSQHTPEQDLPPQLSPEREAQLELGRILSGAARPPLEVWEKAKQRLAEQEPPSSPKR